jgi:EAL domain-containing protein (putative c-di-GMP-specific phosphodiesterase class I)
LEQACRDRQRWLEVSPQGLFEMAVRLSTVQLLTPGFSAAVATLLAQTHTDAASLILEVTDDVYLADAAEVKTALLELKALGVRIALCDFGAGSSSLKNLQRFPLDLLGIDAGFLDGVTADPADAAGAIVVTAITGLAHELGLSVIAKGIQTARQRDAAAAVGCDACQGLYYGDRLSAEAVGEVLGDAVALPIALPWTE